MKKVIYFFCFFITATIAVNAQENGAVLKFEESTFAFGTIKQGEVVEHVFTFENTGNAPLILSDVRTTCGCTVPVWPKEPIPPKATEQIKVKFNSRGKSGQQNKVITIVSNSTGGDVRISLTGTVDVSGK